MPTDNQPSSAPMADAPQPRDDLTAAAVLHDEPLDRPVGGGGLGPSAAPITAGAAAPNSPVDAQLPRDGGDASAEARGLAASSAPAETGHASR